MHVTVVVHWPETTHDRLRPSSGRLLGFTSNGDRLPEAPLM